MPSRALIEDFLVQPHLAFVGVSRDPKDMSATVFAALQMHGHTVYPVNPNAKEISGQPCYASLADVPDPVEGVVVMVPPAAAADVVRAAVARGIPRVWLHRGTGTGSVTDEAVQVCHDNRVDVVDGACPMMFLEPVGLVHRMHRSLSKRRFVS